METLSPTWSTELHTRVDDYLNDKLQTASDIDTLDALLTDVQNRQALLKKQLEEADAALENARINSQGHVAMVQQKAKEFQQRQDDIDRRLKVLTHTNTSDEAARQFEASMNKLYKLEIAAEYIELLKETDTISSKARQSLKSEPRSSVKAYVRLRSLMNALKIAQPAAEGAAPHLVDHVQSQTNELYQNLRQNLSSQFEQTLESMRWPNKDLNLPKDVGRKWAEQVETLLDLQQPDLRDWNTTNSDQSDLVSPLLLPVEVMVKPLALRFRYHFYGNKATNRLDRPEYFLSHIIDLLDSYSGFMSDYLQPLLDRRNESLDLDEAIYTDAISAFISALLPSFFDKCLALLPQVESEPQLLSHFFHELMAFDTTIRESWAYSPTPRLLSDWKGLTWSMLTTHGYFDVWLSAERQFALQRYKSIRDSAESGELDLESTGPQTTKPTKGAIRVNDLLETITDRYRGLVSFSQKLKFLIDIQLAIFDDYHGHLHDALQAYLVTSHTAGRFIQGQGVADQGAFSLRGIESLSKLFGSSEYLERKMSDWSDDIFFLELWDELQDRARRNKRLSGAVGQGLNLSEVAAKTSATIAMKDDDSARETDGGGLFDETAASYRRLRERTEEQIVRALSVNIHNNIRSFTGMGGRATLSSGSLDPSSLSQSASVDTLTQTLSSLLGFLFTVLAPAPLRRITRQACHTIQKDIWDNAIMKHTFSLAGLAQFRRDISAIQQTIDSSIKAPGEADRGMRKLHEALVLLGLPVRASGIDTGVAAQGGDEGQDWGFEEEEGGAAEVNEIDTTIQMNGDEEKVWGLWEVEKRLNQSNESARRVLAEMGLTHLNEKEARNIIARRVEINS